MTTDGATGPIARSVMESNRCDLAQEHEGVRRTYPCGYFWSDDAVADDALTFRAYHNHLCSKERDQRIKPPRHALVYALRQADKHIGPERGR